MWTTPPVVGRLAAITALAACVCPARAQNVGPVDHRVGEANNRIGSGGYNEPPTDIFVPNTANLFITGNVTGGRSFQAFSPIRDPNSVWVGLPSSGLDAFRRDSISLDTALLDRPPGTVSPYYSRQRTTSSLSTLSAGFEQFGGLRSQDIFTIPQPTAAYTMYRFGQPFAPELGSPSPFAAINAGQVSLPQPELSPFLQPLSPYAPLTREVGSFFGAASVTRGYPSGPYTGFAIEGGAWEGDGQSPAPLDVVGQTAAVDLLTRPALLERGETGQTGRLIDPLLRRDPLTGQVLSPELELETLPAEAQAVAEPGALDEETEFDATADAGLDLAGAADEFALRLFSPSGSDVYTDIANAYAFILAQREQAAELEAMLAARPTLVGQYEEAVSAARAILDQPPESFAGSADTAVQHYLRRAEELLRAGEYYQARSLCEQAEVLDRYNPLVLMSQGHAMLAAGEYYSAALKLSRAVELFPGIAFFNLDLRAFITGPDVLEKRRADLERRLEEKEDFRFRFVLGYAEYYSGLEKYGLENLKQAAELAPEHSGIARLHHMLSMELPEMPKQ